MAIGASPFVSSSSSGSSNIDAILEAISKQEATASQANVARQAQVEAIFDEVISRYGPEGSYGKAAEILLGREKVRDVGATAQRDISRGMYGIRPYEQEWEAAVGAPARLKLEDIKMERLSQAQLGKAGFLERIEDEYPDYGLAAQLASQAAAGGGSSGGGAVGGVSSPQYQGSYKSPDWPPKGEEGGYVQGGGLKLMQSAVTGEIKPYSPDMGYAWTAAGSKAYEQYKTNLAKTQGTGVSVATPTEYAEIQKRLKELYPTTTATGNTQGNVYGDIW